METVVEQWALSNGAWGLFTIAFLAATILPFSSEVALAGALMTPMPPLQALAAASAGNCLACLFNYGLGAVFHQRAAERLGATWGGRRALDWSQRYGGIALLASWLPVVGDPLTIVAGVLRVPLIHYVVVVLTLRIVRYGAITWPFLEG